MKSKSSWVVRGVSLITPWVSRLGPTHIRAEFSLREDVSKKAHLATTLYPLTYPEE